MNADAVQAAVRAMHAAAGVHTGRTHCRCDVLARVAVAAAEPIIRAEERERIAAELDRLAATFTALATEARTTFQPSLADTQDDRAECYEDAARIARGGAS